MVATYSEEQIAEFKAFYQQHGTVRLPGLVEPEMVGKLLNMVDEAATRADEPRDPASTVSYGRAPGRMTIRQQWRENALLREFLLRPALVDVMARIIDTRELRFWFDLTFMHDGSPSGDPGAGSDWHHDIGAFAFKGEQVPSLWMALTPTNAERSRLQIISGSHRWEDGFYRPPGMPADKPDGYLAIPDIDAMIASGEVEVITWDCDPGDAIILHPSVVHGASGNLGDKGAGRRVAITTRWLGDDVRFMPTQNFGSDMIAGMSGGLLPIGARPRGDAFPLVWPNPEAAVG